MYEDLSLIPNTSVAKPAVVVCAGHPSAGEMGAPGAQWLASSLVGEYQINEGAVIEKAKVEGHLRNDTQGCLLHTCVYLYTHEHTPSKSD